MTEPEKEKPLRRIAVIGAHGVGEHDPGVTARGIARQLQHTQDGKYSPFVEREYSIKVNGARLTTDDRTVLRKDPNKEPGHLAKGFGSNFAKLIGKTTKPADIEFSRALLLDGDSYKAVYATTELSGMRTDNAGTTRVDIRELYWTDLSHSGSGALAMFDQILQLLVHIASLGRTVAASVLQEQDGKPPKGGWKAFYFLNAFSYWLLSMPIMAGNLMLALLALLLIPALVPPGVVLAGILILAGVLAGGSSGWLLFRAKSVSPQLSVLGALVIAALGAGIAGGLIYRHAAIDQQLLMAGLELLPLFAVGDAVMRRYDISRPGILILWRTLAVLLALWIAAVPIIHWLWHSDEHLSLMHWLAHTAEGLFAFLVAVWFALYVTNLSLLVVGGYLQTATADGKTNKIRRSINTSFIAASVPAPLFLVLVLVLWTAAYHAFSEPAGDEKITMWFTCLFGDQPYKPWDFIGGLIDQSANPFFLIYAAIMLAAGLLLIWGVLLSVIAEISPPPSRTKPGEDPPSAEPLGHWLDGGFTAFGWAAVLAGLGFFIVLPAGAIFQHLPHQPASTTKDALFNQSFIATTAVVFGASAATFMAATKLFASNMNFLAKLRVPIDTALDVDNWMRERPVGNTPRLRIFARFAALLDHVRAGNYDQIVIVAHSQGTVIISDFLRYMQHVQPAFLTTLPQLRFLTVGSPLRQLYALRFPILYEWADCRPTGQIGPDPAQLMLDRWVNSYGSGDYVGRYLWYAQDGAARWTNTPHPSPDFADASEQCIGPWAHTHYLDEDNYTIGDQIDGLIA